MNSYPGKIFGEGHLSKEISQVLNEHLFCGDQEVDLVISDLTREWLKEMNDLEEFYQERKSNLKRFISLLVSLKELSNTSE